MDVVVVFCVGRIVIIIVIFSGLLLLRLFEHFCKILLAHWIGKKEHQKRKKKNQKKKMQVMSSAWCDYEMLVILFRE